MKMQILVEAEDQMKDFHVRQTVNEDKSLFLIYKSQLA